MVEQSNISSSVDNGALGESKFDGGLLSL